MKKLLTMLTVVATMSLGPVATAGSSHHCNMDEKAACCAKDAACCVKDAACCKDGAKCCEGGCATNGDDHHGCAMKKDGATCNHASGCTAECCKTTKK